MPLESPCRREFPEFVSDHVFGHIYRNEFLSIVNRDRVSNHLRRKCRTPRPGFVYLLLSRRIHAVDRLFEVAVYERPFFN